MNQNAFFDDLILMWLYKKGGVISTLDTEDMFGSIFDMQNVNNVVCNRNKTTSYIYRGFIEYNPNEYTLTITQEGRDFIEEKYSSYRRI